tara:strand:+ start:724 stop:918 length:195 start_codon:yes stop_codon:yes gene_type:complete
VTIIVSRVTKQPNKRENIMNKPVFKMTKEECISEMMLAVERTTRTQAICKHFYVITGELISNYC